MAHDPADPTTRHFLVNRTQYAVMIQEVPAGSCSFTMSRAEAWDMAKRKAQAAPRAQNPKHRKAAERIVVVGLDGLATEIDPALWREQPQRRQPAPAEPVQDCRPPAQRPATVRPGRYALDTDEGVKFYIVDHGREGTRWEGYVFVNVQAGDERYPVRNRQQRASILAAIGRDPKAASIRYGREIGCCGVCGRTLTNPESIAAGIGPVCAEGF